MTYLKTSCAHGPVEDVRPDLWLVRLARLLIRDRSRRQHAIHRPDEFRLITPAQGDAYDFTVSVYFTWCITGRERPARLAERVEERHTDLRERLLARLRQVSRGFPPYEAAEAEERIGRVVWELFSQTRFDYATTEGFEGAALPIQARTTLELDEKVRKAQQEAWNRRQQAVNDHDYMVALVPKLSHRRELWQRFLRDGHRDWLTPYAVALTQEPEAAASVVRAMFDDRRHQARELGDELTHQAEKYGEIDAFELMMNNDTVLRRLVELMGIPLAPQLAQAAFGEGAAHDIADHGPARNGESRR